MATLLTVLAVQLCLLVLLSGATFCAVKIFELYAFVEQYQHDAILHARLAELEAALARATAGGAYRAAAVLPPDHGRKSGWLSKVWGG